MGNWQNIHHLSAEHVSCQPSCRGAHQVVVFAAMISPAESEQAEKEQKWLWTWNQQRLKEKLNGRKAGVCVEKI